VEGAHLMWNISPLSPMDTDRTGQGSKTLRPTFPVDPIQGKGEI